VIAANVKVKSIELGMQEILEDVDGA